MFCSEKLPRTKLHRVNRISDKSIPRILSRNQFVTLSLASMPPMRTFLRNVLWFLELKISSSFKYYLNAVTFTINKIILRDAFKNGAYLVVTGIFRVHFFSFLFMMFFANHTRKFPLLYLYRKDIMRFVTFTEIH